MLKVYAFISRFSIPFIHSQFLCQNHTILIIIALYYHLKSGRDMTPALFFLLRIALATLGFLWFHINFSCICYSFMKNFMDNLIGILLNLYIALGNMAILTVLTVLILPIQEHGISFHFFGSCSASFFNVL